MDKSKHSTTNNKNLPSSLNELAEFQLARQLQLATLVIESAYQRLESRGGHYRQDYPQLATVAKTSVIEPLLERPKKQSLSRAKPVKQIQSQLSLSNKDDALAGIC